MGWYCCFIIHSFPFFLLSLLPTFSSRDSSQHQPRIQQTPSCRGHNSTTPSRDDTSTSHEYNRHLPAGDTTAPPPSRDDTSQPIHQPAANTHPAGTDTTATSTPHPTNTPLYFLSNRLLFPFLILYQPTHN